MLSEIYLHHSSVQAFISEYLNSLDEQLAAKAAGKSGQVGKIYAKKLLADPRVSADIQRRMNDRAARLEISADQVLADINRVKEDAMRVCYNPSKERDEMASRGDALKALELLGKHLVLFTDRVQVDASVTVNILSFDETQSAGVTVNGSSTRITDDEPVTVSIEQDY
jgi:phage terminase small subunit